MYVDPSSFVASFRRRWTEDFKNHSSTALEAVWAKQAEVCNHQTACYGTPEAERWRVYSPPTGTGKTQGFAHYCSMLPRDNHPGVLYVSRMTTDADAFVHIVNESAGRTDAIACHSKIKPKPSADTLSQYPVLAITHEAFSRGLKAFFRGQPQKTAWDMYHRFGTVERRLVVIDEALDILEEKQVTLTDLNFVLSILDPHFRTAPEQVSILRALQEKLRERSDKSSDDAPPSLVSIGDAFLNDPLIRPLRFDPEPLCRIITPQLFTSPFGHRNSEHYRRRQSHEAKKILRDIEEVLASWHWLTAIGDGPALATARLIIPDSSIRGAVIFDATAPSNTIYDLLGDRVEMVSPPPGSRHYSNVRIRYALSDRTGKRHCEQHWLKEGDSFVQAVDAVRDRSSKVFGLCHARVEPGLKTLAPDWMLGHWGAIDGKNDWKDCNTVAVFGLPYRPATYSRSILEAYRSYTEARGEGFTLSQTEISKFLSSITTSYLVVSLVQAINRSRSRRVVNADGGCEPVDVFLLLPRRGDEAGNILNGIKAEMPGAVIEEWHYGTPQSRKPRSDFEEALIAYFRSSTSLPGVYSMPEIRRALKISPSTVSRLQARLKDPNSGLVKLLREAGVEYAIQRYGRTRRGCFTKSEQSHIDALAMSA